MKKLLKNLYVRVFVVVLSTYSAFGFILLPFLLQHSVPIVMAKALGAEATLYKASFNPYTFKLKLDGFVLNDSDHRRLASFSTLIVNFDLRDLITGKLLFKQIYLQHLKLDLRADEKGRYNFQHIIDHLAKGGEESGKADENGTVIGVRIADLHIDDARILFEDRELEEPFVVKTRPFDFVLKDFSTVLNEEGRFDVLIATHETGSIQSGAAISLRPFAVRGDFRVEDFNINKLYSYIKENVDFRLEGDRLNAAFDYALSYEEGVLHFDMLASEIDVDRLRYSDANLSAGFGRLKSSIGALRLVSKEGAMQTTFDDLAFGVTDVNYSDQTGMQAEFAALKSSLASIGVNKESGAPLRLRCGDFRLTLENARYRDAPNGMAAGMGLLEHRLDALTLTQYEDNITLQLARSSNAFDNLYYNDPRNSMTLQGADFTLDNFSVDANGSVNANVSAVNFGKIALVNRKHDLLRMNSIAVSDIALDTGRNEYNISTIALNNADMTMRLYKEGKTDFDYLLPEKRSEKKKSGVESADTTGVTPQLNIADVRLNNSRFTFRDLRREPVVLSVEKIDTHIKNAHIGAHSTLAFDFSHRTPRHGRVQGWGQVSVQPLDLSLNLKTTAVDLRPYMPYVRPFVNLELNSSSLNSRLNLRLKQRKTMEVAVKGDVSLQNLDLLHGLTKERLFSVKAINVNRFSYAGNHLGIHDIVIDTPYNRVAIDENRSSNFDGLVVPAVESKERVAEKATKEKAKSGAVTFMLGELVFKNGTLDFSDFSLPLRFKTRVDNLEGRVVAISSSLDENTSVRLDGVVDEYGSAMIGGHLIAADPTKATDIKVDFKNIDVTSLSPYSGKFIGHRIKSGKLWLDLGYKIDNKALMSSNKIKMKDLALGESVESDEALNLPVGLAIALLKDSEGYIDVSLPVEGNVDDPDFKYGGALFKAVKNLIVGIASAPFRFLGEALGIDAEAMAKIEFDYGRSELMPPEKEKLDKLIGVFAQRPEIGLVLTPGYTLPKDKTALQKEKLYASAVGMFKENDDQSSKYGVVKQLYIQTFGDAAYAEQYKTLQRGLKEGDDFDALLFERQLGELIAVQTVTSRELQALAFRRSQAIRDHLLGKGFDAQRIRVVDKASAQDVSDAELFTMTLGIDVSQR